MIIKNQIINKIINNKYFKDHLHNNKQKNKKHK